LQLVPITAQGHRSSIRHLALIIVTMGLSPTVSEINGDFSRFPLSCILRPCWKGTFSLELGTSARVQKN